jgi:hypothetical protein
MIIRNVKNQLNNPICLIWWCLTWVKGVCECVNIMLFPFIFAYRNMGFVDGMQATTRELWQLVKIRPDVNNLILAVFNEFLAY